MGHFARTSFAAAGVSPLAPRITRRREAHGTVWKIRLNDRKRATSRSRDVQMLQRLTLAAIVRHDRRTASPRAHCTRSQLPDRVSVGRKMHERTECPLSLACSYHSLHVTSSDLISADRVSAELDKRLLHGASRPTTPWLRATNHIALM